MISLHVSVLRFTKNRHSDPSSVTLTLLPGFCHSRSLFLEISGVFLSAHNFFLNSSRYLGRLTAANWVSFDFNVSYSSCWGYSLINTLKKRRKKESVSSKTQATAQRSRTMHMWGQPCGKDHPQEVLASTLLLHLHSYCAIMRCCWTCTVHCVKSGFVYAYLLPIWTLKYICMDWHLYKTWSRRLRAFKLRVWGCIQRTQIWKKPSSAKSCRVWNRRLKSPTKTVCKGRTQWQPYGEITFSVNISCTCGWRRQ